MFVRSFVCWYLSIQLQHAPKGLASWQFWKSLKVSGVTNCINCNHQFKICSRQHHSRLPLCVNIHTVHVLINYYHVGTWVCPSSCHYMKSFLTPYIHIALFRMAEAWCEPFYTVTVVYVIIDMSLVPSCLRVKNGLVNMSWLIICQFLSIKWGVINFSTDATVALMNPVSHTLRTIFKANA